MFLLFHLIYHRKRLASFIKLFTHLNLRGEISFFPETLFLKRSKNLMKEHCCHVFPPPPLT